MFELINCQEVKDTLLAILGLSKKTASGSLL